MDHDIHFDLGIGISAGSANLASFAAGQRGRNYQFYMEYAFRKQYMAALLAQSPAFGVHLSVPA
ncbi:hypothetical protein [Pseudoflavonifractor sp. MCC625]|uniref:hypothetical protein n=1 Tax=Pseudoflavonifractor sp. MCC625 TaxID=2592647 RepID=UPI003211B670